MPPTQGALGAEAVTDGVEDLLAVQAVDVLLLRSKRQHAGTLAEHHQPVPSVGLIEEGDAGSDAHGEVLARGADPDEQAVPQDRVASAVFHARQRVTPVLPQPQLDRRPLGCLVVFGVLEQLVRDLTVLGVLGQEDKNPLGTRDALAQVVAGHLCGPVTLDRGGDLRVPDELGLGAHKWLLRIDGLVVLVLREFLGYLVRLRLRGLSFGRGRCRLLPLQLGIAVLPRRIHETLGRGSS
mmetsp:Transcript_52487/g.156595  ORF Transcript_52487/g.156595 Transcript_52487/m.156595 type:complete len:238 (+) Transcript_52487:956-1669(+)